MTREMVGGCCVCSDERGWQENPLVYCDGKDCSVAVHQACYGIVNVPSGPWYCEKCLACEKPGKVKCELCPIREGAVKHTDNSGWAHVVCALYIPEVRFGNVTTMDPIILSGVPPDRFSRICYICEERGFSEKKVEGACMQCNKLGCKTCFHVTCAQQEGLLCEESGQMDNIKYCGYCSYHFKKLKKDMNIKMVPPYRPSGHFTTVSTNSAAFSVVETGSVNSDGGSSTGSPNNPVQARKPTFPVNNLASSLNNSYNSVKIPSSDKEKLLSSRTFSNNVSNNAVNNNNNNNNNNSTKATPLVNSSVKATLSNNPSTLMTNHNFASSSSSSNHNGNVAGKSSANSTTLKQSTPSTSCISNKATAKQHVMDDGAVLTGTNHMAGNASANLGVFTHGNGPTLVSLTNTYEPTTNDFLHASSHGISIPSTSSFSTVNSGGLGLAVPVAVTATNSLSTANKSSPSPYSLHYPNNSNQTTPSDVHSSIAVVVPVTKNSNASYTPLTAIGNGNGAELLMPPPVAASSSVAQHVSAVQHLPASKTGIGLTSTDISPTSSVVAKKRANESGKNLSALPTGSVVHSAKKARRSGGSSAISSSVIASSASMVNSASSTTTSTAASQSAKNIANLLTLVSPVVEDTVSSFQREKVQASQMLQMQQQQQQQRIEGVSGVANGIVQPQAHRQFSPHLNRLPNLGGTFDTTNAYSSAVVSTGSKPSNVQQPIGHQSSTSSGDNSTTVGIPLARSSHRSMSSESQTGAFPSSLEQLLERQWEQGSQFLMEQSQHFDIASLITCLNQLKVENQRLEDHILNLIARRDHLLAVNARLSILPSTQQSPHSPRTGTSLATATGQQTSGAPPPAVVMPQTGCGIAGQQPTTSHEYQLANVVTSTALINSGCSAPAVVQPQQRPMPNNAVVSGVSQSTNGSAAFATSSNQSGAAAAYAAALLNASSAPGVGKQVALGSGTNQQQQQQQIQAAANQLAEQIMAARSVAAAAVAQQQATTPAALLGPQFAAALSQDAHHQQQQQMLFQLMQQQAVAYNNALSGLLVQQQQAVAQQQPPTTSPHHVTVAHQAASALAQAHLLQQHQQTRPLSATTSNSSQTGKN